MRLHRIAVALGVFAALTLAAPAGHAFTIENKDAGGGAYNVPNFDIGEQAKQFSRDGTGASGKPGYSLPLGSGTLELGVGQGTTSGFNVAPPFNSGFGRPLNTRRDFERVVTPENLR